MPPVWCCRLLNNFWILSLGGRPSATSFQKSTDANHKTASSYKLSTRRDNRKQLAATIIFSDLNFHLLASKILGRTPYTIANSFLVFNPQVRSDSLIVVTTGRGMVEIPLTSYVVDGQTKWTVMSERKEGNNGDKSQQREKSHKCNNCSLTRDLSSITCRHT